MKSKTTHTGLREALLLLRRLSSQSGMTLKEILSVSPHHGRSLLVLLLSLPFCLPIAIPGVSTPFGIAIALIAGRTAFNLPLWLPKKWAVKKVSKAHLKKIIDKTLWVLDKLKPVLKRRYPEICRSHALRRCNAVILVLLGLLLAMPLPIPLSNVFAAWPIACIQIGLLEEDGLFLLIGYLLFTVSILYFTFLTLSVKFLVGYL